MEFHVRLGRLWRHLYRGLKPKPSYVPVKQR